MVSKLCLEFLTSLQTSQTDYAGANHNTNFNMKLWISCETSAGSHEARVSKRIDFF